MMPLILDSFAGGGGASEGIRLALGRHPDIAVNHDEQALALHAANHPETLHVTEDVWHVDWRKLVAGRPVGLAWFSPDCKHFSKAKGGKPVSKNIRGLAWVVLKVAGLVKPSVIILENVEEFRDWGPLVDDKPCPRRKGMTFKRWATQLRNLGYAVEYREVRACDYRTPTIRKRLFVIARRDGKPIVWPAPTHFDQRTKRKAKQGTLFDAAPTGKPWRTAAECIDWSIPCPSIFTRKKPLADATLKRIARGIMRYVVDNPHPFIIPVTHTGDSRSNPTDEPLRTVTGASRGEMALVTPFVARVDQTSAAERTGIQGPEDPLRTVTAAGGLAVITPILAGCGGRAGQSPPKSVDAPFNTVTAKADQILVVPHLTKFHGDNPGAPIDGPMPTVTANSFIKRAGCAVPIGLVSACLTPRYGERPGQEPRARDIAEPMATVVPTQNGAALVAAFLAQHNGGMVGHDAREPVSTLSQKGSQQQLVSAAFIKRDFGTSTGASADDPLPTITADGGGHASLVAAFMQKYYSTGGQHAGCDEPAHTTTAKARLGLVTVTIAGEPYVIVDIGMRMLSPRELFRAQGFEDSYIIDPIFKGKPLTKTAQIRMCGNSVCPPVAEALIAANCADLAMPGWVRAA